MESITTSEDGAQAVTSAALFDRKKLVELTYSGVLAAIAFWFGRNTFWTQAITDWMQVALTAVVFILIVRDEDALDTTPDRPSRALAQFYAKWKALWIVWFFLYLFFGAANTFSAINHGPVSFPPWNMAQDMLENLINNLQSFFVFALFLVMTVETLGAKAAIYRRSLQIGALIIAALVALEFMFCVIAPWLFDAAHIPQANDVWRVSGIGFSTISGLATAVTLCLLIGRFGSHHLRLAPSWVATMYVYATIQPLFPLFRVLDSYTSTAPEVIRYVQVALKIAAAVFKLLLFIQVREIMKDTRLLFFFARSAEDEVTIAGAQEAYRKQRLAAEIPYSDP